MRHPQPPAVVQAPRAVDHDRLDAHAGMLGHQESPVFEPSDLSRLGARPFREDDHRRSARQPLPATFEHLFGAAPRAAFDRNVAVHPQHPTENGHFLHLFFRYPFERRGQYVHQRDVEHRLMVRDDHPRPTAVDFFGAFYPYAPPGAQPENPVRPHPRGPVQHHPFPVEKHRQQE